MRTTRTYVGIEKRDAIKNDKHLSAIDYRIVRRPKSLPKISENTFDWDRMIEHRKSSIRCKVEHPFHFLKNKFGFKKVRYRGIAKNLNKLYSKNSHRELYSERRAINQWFLKYARTQPDKHHVKHLCSRCTTGK